MADELDLATLLRMKAMGIPAVGGLPQGKMPIASPLAAILMGETRGLQSATSSGAGSTEPALPPGIRLDKNGVAYDAHTGQKVRKRLFEGREE